MAYRPTQYVIEGELDNTRRGIVTGWISFAGISKKVKINLTGDFHESIRGTKLRFHGYGAFSNPKKAKSYMEYFSVNQEGKAGDILVEKPDKNDVNYSYIEWYSADSGRVVLEMRGVEVIDQPYQMAA